MEFRNENRINIREQNYWAIYYFAYQGEQKRIQGQKLEALYRLIQWKGKPLCFENEHLYDGIKVIEFGDKDFIGFIRTGVSQSDFFPCKLQTLVFRDLGKVRKAKIG